MPIVKWLIYLWVLPTSLPGLVMALLTLATGGQAKVVDGVLEICGGASDFYLRRVVGLVMSGGASAMTLGHVVLGRDLDLLDATRSHERIHVRQCEKWGPLFIPLYLGASLVVWMKGLRAYEDNPFEREAYEKAG